MHGQNKEIIVLYLILKFLLVILLLLLSFSLFLHCRLYRLISEEEKEDSFWETIEDVANKLFLIPCLPEGMLSLVREGEGKGGRGRGREGERREGKGGRREGGRREGGRGRGEMITNIIMFYRK